MFTCYHPIQVIHTPMWSVAMHNCDLPNKLSRGLNWVAARIYTCWPNSSDLLSYEVALRININIRTTRKSTRKPLRTLSKFASEFFQTYFSGKRRHSVLFGTTLADTLSPSWSTHAWNLPENSWTPRMLNISQKRSETTRTLPIPGMAANNALMTTWVC